MPTKTMCPRCLRIGLVRYEYVIRGKHTSLDYYCGGCDYEWSVALHPRMTRRHRHPRRAESPGRESFERLPSRKAHAISFSSCRAISKPSMKPASA